MTTTVILMQLAEITAVVSLVLATMDIVVMAIHVSMLMSVPMVTTTVMQMRHVPTLMELLFVLVMTVTKELASHAEISMNALMEMIVMLMPRAVIPMEVTRVTAEWDTAVMDSHVVMLTNVTLLITATIMPHVVIPLDHIHALVILDMKVTESDVSTSTNAIWV